MAIKKQKEKSARQLLSELEAFTGLKRPHIFAFETRQAFLETLSYLKSFSKNCSTIVGLVFAGSLTYLGLLKGHIFDSELLGSAWVFLGASVVAQLALHLAGLGGLLSHWRTEGANVRAVDGLKIGGKDVNELARLAIVAHQHEQNFRATSNLVLPLFIAQVAALVVAGVLLGIFVSKNLG